MAASLFGVGNVINLDAQGTLMEESFVATAGQLIFDLTSFSYATGSGSIKVFVNGQKQRLGYDYAETSSTRFTWLTEDLQEGDRVDVIGFPEIDLSNNIDPTIRPQLASPAPGNGAEMIAFLQSGTGAVARTAQSKMRERITAADHGIVGAGDETAKIQALLDDLAPYTELIFETGATYTISAQLTIPVDYVTVRGLSTIKAADGAQFEYMMLGTGRTGCKIVDLTFDANKAGRTSGQSVRFMGAGFLSSTDCDLIRVTAKNCRGYSSVSAVGLFAAGGSTRCRILFPKLFNCGDAGFDADGVFTSGDRNLIFGGVAEDCTDTGFVIESSNGSGIVGCSTNNCAAVAAITSANASDKRGNYISGVTGINWSGGTGGIQIGVPGAYAGNLYDTRVDGVTLYADTAGGKGVGPAIAIRQAGSGRAIGVTITSPRIRGATTQGILVDGDDVQIVSPNIKGTTDGCIQFQTGRTGGIVDGGKLDGGSYGVFTAGTSEAAAKGVTTLNQTAFGYSAQGTSVLTLKTPDIRNSSATQYEESSGAVLAARGTGRVVPVTYSASMTLDIRKGDTFIISANNGTAFTINDPTNYKTGDKFNLCIKNTSGGALGAITWGASFSQDWVSPATTKNRSAMFECDGSITRLMFRSASDLSN